MNLPRNRAPFFDKIHKFLRFHIDATGTHSLTIPDVLPVIMCIDIARTWIVKLCANRTFLRVCIVYRARASCPRE